MGWPPEGSLDPQAVRVVWDVVTSSPCHPDQFPYASHWLTLALQPLLCLKTYILQGSGSSWSGQNGGEAQSTTGSRSSI